MFLHQLKQTVFTLGQEPNKLEARSPKIIAEMEAKELRTEAGMGRWGGVGDGPSDAGARGGPPSGPHYPGIAVSVRHAAGSLTCISAGQPPASPS